MSCRTYPSAIPVITYMSFLHSMQESIFFTTAPARCSCSVPAPLRLDACATPVLHSHSSLFFARRADNAEAQVVAGDIGVAAPAAAAVVAYVAVVGVEIPEILVQISAPFPHVSAHVIQAVTVGFFCTTGCVFSSLFL